tara:strand:+ start:1339 stop:2832 length:1494 start_codon:yes stop_codon:yes gene_type:complete
MAKVKVNGRIIDSKTNEGLSGAKAVLGPYSATTNEFGSYTIEYDLIDGVPPPSTIRFAKGGYVPKQASAITQSGTPKSAINVAELKPLKLNFGIDLPKIIVLGSLSARKIKSSTGNSPESKAIELALKEASNLYERLIPFSAKQLARFGIQDPSDIANKSCPPITEINKAITDKNKTTRQLNNSYKTIRSLSKSSGVLEVLLKAIKIIFKLLKKNPLPSTIGLPPGPAGGVIISQTMGNITSYDEKREITKKIIDKLSEVVKVFPDATIPISLALGESLSLLSATDTSVGECLNDIRQSVLDELNKKSGGDVTGAISDSNGGDGQGANGGVGTGDGIGTNLGIGVGSNGNNISGGGLNTADAAKAGINTIDNFDFKTVSDSELKNILGLDPDSTINVQDLLAGNYLQEQLDKELTGLTEESANDGQPSITEYNGFVISVETESESAAAGKSIKRRFAVGKNRDGVLLVQGDKSYSSNDQVLIDELIFKIESEDLKSA